ncbi:hypothetical protein, partial [Salinibacter ruber]|uniref:hypothetical protein n=1 Tax=Salinibacter ruber TaxID=146919 RepID=UPI0020740D9F
MVLLKGQSKERMLRGRASAVRCTHHDGVAPDVNGLPSEIHYIIFKTRSQFFQQKNVRAAGSRTHPGLKIVPPFI